MQVPHRFSLEKKEWATQAQEIGSNPGGPQETGGHSGKCQPGTPVRKLAYGVGTHSHSCVADAETPSDGRVYPTVLESRPALRSNRAGTLGMGNDSICLTVARSRAQRRTRPTLRERGRRMAALTNDPGSVLVAMGSRQDSRRCVAAA